MRKRVSIYAKFVVLVGSSVVASLSFAQSERALAGRGLHPVGKAIEGEYIVKMKSRFTKSSSGVPRAFGKFSNKMSLKHSFSRMQMYHMKVHPTDTATVEELQKDPDVEYIEPNFLVSLVDNGKPDVVMESASQVAAQSDVQAQGYAQFSNSNVQTGFNNAWSASSNVSNGKIIVAVVDTGLNTQHDLFMPLANGGSGALWKNTNEIIDGIDNDGNGYIDDVNGWNFIANTGTVIDDEGHGTHVAGIVVGAGLDIFAGSLPESKILIMPLKFLDSHGSGSVSLAVNAIYYAVQNGAKVINNSWGGSSYSRSLHDAITFAYNNNVLVVNAAGNDGRNNDSNNMYPANLDVPSSLAIGASTTTDNLAGFSNYGMAKVPLAAPGYLTSTYPFDSYGAGCNTCYALMSGTSMATPLVAGIAALAWREAPQMSAYVLRNMVVSSVTRFASLNNKVTSGGRINPLSLINNSINENLQPVSDQNYRPVYTPNYAVETATISSSSSRAPASTGCGSIAAISSNFMNGGGGNASPEIIEMSLQQKAWPIILLILPVLAVVLLRANVFLKTRSIENLRAAVRVPMKSFVRIHVGKETLIAESENVSAGGMGLVTSERAKALLARGKEVIVEVISPTGESLWSMDAKVAWEAGSGEMKRFGISFLDQAQKIAS